MLIVVVLIVVMLNPVMLSVIILNVVVPSLTGVTHFTILAGIGVF